MKAYRRLMGILVLFALLIVGPAGNVLGQNQNAPGDRGHFRMGLWPSLTQEQRQAVRSTITQMREQGSSREEIHAAVGEMLKAYGIEVPEHWGKGFSGGPRRFFGRLTDEQREAVQEKVKQMRDQGASPEEIHAAVAQMLKGYGIDLPEHWGKGFQGDPRRFFGRLTDEQRKVVREKMKEMREQGATREEIHATVAEMLKGYGIELPEHWGKGFPGGPRGFLSQLTAEQRKAVQEKVKGMRDQGASPEEIHAAVAEMLKGYGVELPESKASISSPTEPPELQITAQSSPNPFNPETQITYTLTAPGEVRVRIYNVTGEMVRTFNEGYRAAGSYSLQWDGGDANGNRAASGIYFYRIEAGPYSAPGRMILLR